MSRHGLSRKGICTISAKVNLEVRDKLDEIKNKLKLKNRSEVLRLVIKAYISNRWGCIPHLAAHTILTNENLLACYYVLYIDWYTNLYANKWGTKEWSNPELKIWVDCMNKGSIEIKLNEELKSLQNKFNKGHELTLKYLPNEIRYNENNKPLAGEIINDIIIIYEAKEEKAVQTLYHEFIEFLIIPLLKDSFYIISYQNKIITQLLLNKKEDIVEQLSHSLRERALND